MTRPSAGHSPVAAALDAEARISAAVDRVLEHWVQAGILERQEVEAAIRAAVTVGPRREVEVVAENMQRALDACGGHVVRAAELIGVASKSVYNRLKAAEGGFVSRRFAGVTFTR